MKKLIIVLALISSQLMAQKDSLRFKKTFEIEVDPLAYLLKGYSVHGIYNHNHLRFDLGYFGIEIPGEWIGNENYTIRNTGFGLKINYMLKKVNGLYSGIDFGYGETTATENESKLQDKGHNLSLGTHLGYRIFLFPNQKNALNGLYLTPWAGISYNHVYDKIKFENYKNSKLGYFATFHIGYRF
jgi:hypothetical protein